MPVKVSICIPTYNQTEFLKKNLESIRLQTYKDFEVIITDDSTTDVVKKEVESFFASFACQYTYHKNEPALGSPANWNKAISLATGRYIKIMHHDDWFTNESSLGIFVNALDMNSKADFAFSSTSIYDVTKQTYSTNIPDSDFLMQLNQDPLVLFNCNKIGAPSTTIYRNNKGIRFDEKMSYLVDIDFYIQYLKYNPDFVFINELLITNTSNYPHQVTSSSITKEVQIGEYCYLYNKLFDGAFPSKKYRIFFKDLFAWYKLNSFNEIEDMGYEKPRPHWIFNWLSILAKMKKQ